MVPIGSYNITPCLFTFGWQSIPNHKQSDARYMCQEKQNTKNSVNIKALMFQFVADRLASMDLAHKHFVEECEQLAVIDVWRYLNSDIKEFTWSNANRSLQSRIDLWYISPSCLQFVSESSHDFAPLSDHKLITIHLVGNKQKQRNSRCFWKLNDDLLNDDTFRNIVKKERNRYLGIPKLITHRNGIFLNSR